MTDITAGIGGDQGSRARLKAAVDWAVLSIGVASLGFAVIATVLSHDTRVSDASAVQEPAAQDI